ARAVGEQARRITRIMQRLLSHARERMPSTDAVRIEAIARNTAEFLEPEFAARGVRLEVVGDASLHARGDPDMIQQVLLNLAMNGLQASPKGGRVTIDVRRVDELVAMDVIDDGPGVAEEILPRLFEPFAT